MNSHDEILSFMDLLDIDEEVIDSRLKSIMKRTNFTNQHLKNAIYLLQYKNTINLQEDTECENDEECLFITKLINEIREENIDYVCKITSLVLSLNKTTMLNKSEHLFQQIILNLELPLQNPKSTSEEEIEDQKTLLGLKLCDSILDVVIKNHQKLIIYYFEAPLENILSSNDVKLNVHFLNNTVPRLFQGIQGYNILDRILNYLKHLGSENKDNALKILSCLSEFYLPVADKKENMILQSEIALHNEFWDLLLYGLTSMDPSIRKISIYLLKRAIDSWGFRESDLKIAQQRSIFTWTQNNAKTLKENWDNFFILIDSLEEKQSNIVLPSLQLFETFKYIDSCWLNCAFNIGLRHDNMQVRLKCIEYRLETQLDSQSDAMVLLEALNDVNLYDQHNTAENLHRKITQICKGKNTLMLIIKSIPKIKWSPVPLYYLSDVLARVDIGISIFHSTELAQVFADIMKIPCNNVIIRNAIKINITYFIGNCCKHFQWRELMILYSLVNWNKHSLESRDKNPLLNVIKDLRLDENEKKEFFKVGTDSYINIEFSLLYLKAQKHDINKFMELVTVKIKNLQEIVGRQYSKKSVCFNDVLYLTHLYKKSQDDDILREQIAVVISQQYQTILQYILTLFSSDEQFTIEEIELIFKGFTSMANTVGDINVKEKLLEMYKVSIKFLTDKQTNLDKKLLAVFVINSVTDQINTSYRCEMLNLKDLLELIKNIKFIESSAADGNGRLRNAFFEKSCQIVNKYITVAYTEENQSAIKNVMKELVNYIKNVIECGGYGCLIWILQIMNQILPELLEDEKIKFNIKQFVSRMWKEIEELQSNKQYSPCIEQFVKLIIQDSLLQKPKYNELIILYCRNIVESLKNSPLFYLTKELSKKTINEDTGQLIYVLCDILLFSPVPKKDHRIIDNVSIEILENTRYGLDKEKADVHFNFIIQYSAILTLSTIKNLEIFETISSLIISKIEGHLKTKQRYHGNSQTHRLLLIGLQHLIFLSLLNVKILESQMIAFWVTDLLGRLPHQPSVRTCLEWYIALHLNFKKTGIDKKSIQIMQSKNIPITSQFMVLIWVIKHKIGNDSCGEEEFEFVMDHFLSHTMGQMFNLRLHAQYLAFELHKMRNSDKYSYITEVIEKTFKESAKDKNFIKLKNDYFVNNFDIVANLTPCFIYYFIPRYYEIGNNESIDEKYIRNVLLQINDNIKTSKADSDVKKEWKKLHKTDDEIFNNDICRDLETSKDVDGVETMGTIQKKYIPWKNMSEIDFYNSEKKKETSSELIVVASLIDKLPNLGGMARTSEIFGVKTYVVDSLKHLQDKQFQGLSVSAERWVNIEEVRPGQPLKDYLIKMKAEGYSVIAAEQTSTSSQLQQFKFPKKTLLLLGHEKEGIPCDFLPLMDHCVEIPQQGYIRSLNVHVTAAIFVWEYSRQNIL